MLTLTTVASNKQTSKDKTSHNRLLFNMTVRSVQQIRWQPEWNPENKIAKATQLNLAHRSSCTGKHGQFRTAACSPVLANWPCTRPDCNWYGNVAFALPAFATALVVPGCTVAVAIFTSTLLARSCKLLHCGVRGCSDCSSAVVLEMHTCVGRDQHLCCLLFPPRHQHVCAFIITSV